MHRITSTVHSYGGTVDRTMGDGLLCFFGYSYDGTVVENHAQSAIACAQEIQRINVQHCISARTSGTPIWPFRIGINTTSAFIGDMGDEDRLDLTLIGSGVNLAQRFEASCTQHSVMLSLATFDLLSPVQKEDAGVHRCKIKVKNQQELLDCIEIDPLSEAPDERQKASEALRQFLVLERLEERWPVSSHPPLNFQSIYGSATLVDFSKTGVGLLLPVYLAKNVPVTFELTSTDKQIEEKINIERLQKFRAEVRWGRKKGELYLHGFLCTDLNEAQQQAFVTLLRDTCLKT